MGERPDEEVCGAHQQHNQEGELQPDDPLDPSRVDQREEGDDDGGHGPLGQRGVVRCKQPGDRLAETGGAQGVADGLADDIDDADGGAAPRPEHVGDEEVDAAGADVAALADADGGEDGHQDKGDGSGHDGGGAGYTGLRYHPSGAEENDDSEDVDEAGGKDAVPGAEENAAVRRDQQAGQPPGRGSGTLDQEIEASNVVRLVRAFCPS